VGAGIRRVVISGKRPFGCCGLVGGVVNKPDLERMSSAGQIAGAVGTTLENGWYLGASFRWATGGVGPCGGDCFW